MALRIGAYTVVRELARGGMGVVYVARHEALGREVALKLLLASRSSESARARFQAEAQVVARLRHPHIVAIHEVGLHQGAPYLVMDLVDGESLEARIERDGPLPPADAVRIVEEVSRAVAYAHAQGILHRDLKPGNVLIERRRAAPALDQHDASGVAERSSASAPANVLLASDGRALLTDFGLAKDLSDERARLTRSGQLLGTPVFMPPEQAAAEHERVDERSDVYALGMTLYQALTGEVPFLSDSLIELLTQIVERAPRPPSELRPELPRELDSVVLMCLEKEPARRYASAELLAQDLARWRRDEPVTASRSGLGTRARAWLRRGRRSRGSVLAGALLVLCGGAIVAHQAVLAPRARAAEELAAEERWQAESLTPLLYGLRPGAKLEAVQAGELRRRLAELEGVERVLGPSPASRAARARLEAYQRLLELRRQPRRPPSAPLATERELPHLLVDAIALAQRRDLPALWSALDEAERLHPGPEVREVRLALLARHDPATFLRGGSGSSSQGPSDPGSGGPGSGASEADAALARELAPEATQRLYARVLGPAFAGTAEDAHRELSSLAQALGGWSGLPPDLLARARDAALEDTAEAWSAELPAELLLQSRLDRLELVLADPPAPPHAPRLAAALEAALQRTLGGAPSLGQVRVAAELERVAALLDGRRREAERLRGAVLRLVGAGPLEDAPLLHALLRHGAGCDLATLAARASTAALLALRARYPRCPCAGALEASRGAASDPLLLERVLTAPRATDLAPRYRFELGCERVRLLAARAPSDRAAAAAAARGQLAELRRYPAPLAEAWRLHDAVWWAGELAGQHSPAERSAAARYTRELREAARPDAPVERAALAEWLERQALRPGLSISRQRELLGEAYSFAAGERAQEISARLAALGE
ncbi:MAG: protein kinase [Planctomycetota bacterium]